MKEWRLDGPAKMEPSKYVSFGALNPPLGKDDKFFFLIEQASLYPMREKEMAI